MFARCDSRGLRRAAVLGAVTLAVTLAGPGCSKEKSGSTVPARCSKPPDTATGTPPLTPATRVVANEADGFSVALPEGWKDIVIDNAQIQKLFNEGSGNDKPDEAILNQVRTLIQRGGKLLAYDECERTTSLNVLKLPAEPGVTTEKVAEGLPAQLTELGLRDVKVEVAPVAAGPSAKATGTQTVKKGKDDVDLLQIQYYVVSGPSTFVAILTTDDPARDQPTLEAIGASFSLTQPAK